MPRALTVGGSDPSGAAGIQQDMRTFSALGVWGCSVVTAITVQDASRVHASHNVEPDVVRAQIDAVIAGARAVKTGMLPTASCVVAVAQAARDHAVERLVVDPVMVASSGDTLIDDDAIDAMKKELIPLAYVVTPNAHEASVLSGVEVIDGGTQTRAARAVVALGARACVVTGGHVRHHGSNTTDVMAFDQTLGAEMGLHQDGMGFQRPSMTIEGLRGAGGVYAAALTAGLARGELLYKAAGNAFMLVGRAMKERVQMDGKNVLDPRPDLEA
ncbi:MAG: hydroxymethylpyrimidine/phosphomethylpyrimidine kinase [Actinomycetota bacterium]|nr:hydroxymethylpyrimidine/phosphomethylpyrimidine kinase [Actinomycetota bacterium]